MTHERWVLEKKVDNSFLLFFRPTILTVGVQRELKFLRMSFHNAVTFEHGHFDRDDVTIEFEQFVSYIVLFLVACFVPNRYIVPITNIRQFPDIYIRLHHSSFSLPYRDPYQRVNNTADNVFFYCKLLIKTGWSSCNPFDLTAPSYLAFIFSLASFIVKQIIFCSCSS